MKLFLDTNVVIDFITERSGFYEDAATLMAYASLKDNVETTISLLTIVNAWYVSTQQYKLPIADVRDKIERLRAYLKIYGSTASDFYAAFDAQWKDLEDGVQYYSAKQCGCDYIVTRNVKDFKMSDIPVVTPIEMNELIYELKKNER